LLLLCVNRSTEADGASFVDIFAMPTVLLLDVSLSMSRTVLGAALSSPTTDANTYRSLAVHGINSMLDYLTANNKLEFISLV